MAVSEILGLFQTPDQYTAAQDAALQRQFIQRATLDPFQKASVLGQQAGYSAAQGIGGALGGKDPQLEMISRRNMLLSQLNPNDPKTYAKVAEVAAQMGDPQFAVLIAQEGRKAESESALGEFRRAQAKRENREIDPFQKLVESGKYTPPSLAEFQKSGNPADLVLYEKPEKPVRTNYGNAADILSKAEYGKPFDDLTQAEAKIIDTELERRGIKKASAGAAQTNVNAYVPASVEAQKQYIQDIAKERTVLRTAPDTIKNIEAAIKLIPTASTFMGKGGEPLLAAASFLNNRLGLNINTQGVTDATVLRTRLFEGILDNLKKLDSQPSQEQQRVLSEALGNLGTDPAALEQILNRIGETVADRVDRYNTDVNESEARGIKFPFKPQITLPQRQRSTGSASSQIPTQSSVPTASQKPIYATNPTTKERIMSIDGGINWTSAR